MISDERRDYYAGALLVAMGVGAAYFGGHYQVGSVTHMGPGFVPTALGVLLAFIGVLLIIFNWRAIESGEIGATAAEPHGIATTRDTPDWRGGVCIIASVLLFVLLAQYGGLAPATFCCVFVASRGDRTVTWLQSVLLAAGITAFGLALFAGLLKVELPVIQGW